MTSAVEQYRALVAKLEAINPSEPVTEEPGGYNTVVGQQSDDDILAEIAKSSKNTGNGSK
jgi:hypothetical protein